MRARLSYVVIIIMWIIVHNSRKERRVSR